MFARGVVAIYGVLVCLTLSESIIIKLFMQRRFALRHTAKLPQWGEGAFCS